MRTVPGAASLSEPPSVLPSRPPTVPQLPSRPPVIQPLRSPRSCSPFFSIPSFYFPRLQWTHVRQNEYCNPHCCEGKDHSDHDHQYITAGPALPSAAGIRSRAVSSSLSVWRSFPSCLACWHRLDLYGIDPLSAMPAERSVRVCLTSAIRTSHKLSFHWIIFSKC